MPYVGSALVQQQTSTNYTMLARAPWPQPVGKYFVLRKLVATSQTAAMVSGGVLNVWDQDLSNTTPIARGSGGLPLLSIPITPVVVSGQPCQGMTILDIDACPQQFFQAGITCQTSASGGVLVSFEADVI